LSALASSANDGMKSLSDQLRPISGMHPVPEPRAGCESLVPSEEKEEELSEQFQAFKPGPGWNLAALDSIELSPH
ncbi:MAG: hypothetical protein OXF86_22495, partial [Caldilineaceae bacterium]|nr:hypothetical protein [Caldilineaceae bacterium]